MENKQLIIEEFESKLGVKFNNSKELEELLSEKFREAMENNVDAQLAFNELDSEVSGLLNKYCCYYLTDNGVSWSVDTGDLFNNSNIELYLSKFKDEYNEEFKSIEDMTSKLENKVLKDMSNAGCDCKSALRMILEEDLDLVGVFSIVGADAEPTIELIK